MNAATLQQVHRENLDVTTRCFVRLELIRHCPFDGMDRAELEWAVDRFTPGEHLEGAAVPADGLHLVLSGTLAFDDARRLDRKRGRSSATVRARTRVRCLEMKRDDFLALQDRNAAFRAFCERIIRSPQRELPASAMVMLERAPLLDWGICLDPLPVWKPASATAPARRSVLRGPRAASWAARLLLGQRAAGARAAPGRR